MGPDTLEVVASFCYLGDMLAAGGGCELAVTAVTTRQCENSLEEIQGSVTSSYILPRLLQEPWPCVQLLHAELHASETMPLTKMNLQRLQRNDRAMIRQICSIKPEDVATVRSNKLLVKLEDLDLILRERSHWFGHVEHSSGAVRTACDIQVDGRQEPGIPKLTWKKLTDEWKKGAPGDQV